MANQIEICMSQTGKSQVAFNAKTV